MKRLSLLDIFHVRHTQAQGRPSEEIISTCPNFEVFFLGFSSKFFGEGFQSAGLERKNTSNIKRRMPSL
jgi:hypothetical protein